MIAPQPEMSRQDAIATQALLAGLTELSSRATHDLLGPLHRSASLLTLFVKRYRNRLDHEADHLLEFLASASTSMEGVAAGVRKYMEIAARAPSFGPVDLNVSLASSLAQLEKAISANGAVIVSDSLPTVLADAAHMVTLFETLIGNSIKFCRPDVPPRIRVSSGSEGDIRTIAIADNGIGIDRENRETVFLPFKRLHGAEYPGAGLGLAVAKLITELHGGSIRIDSHVACESSPCGTRIRFTVRAIEAK
jgi:light-regulated signal transduction histidine kinase (bacteriophytochrome)